MASSELGAIKVMVEPETTVRSGIAMMPLTRAKSDSAIGLPQQRWEAGGRVFVDANRIEAITEARDDIAGDTVFVTLQSGCEWRVMETLEQVGALMTVACNPFLFASMVGDALGTLAGIVGVGGVGVPPSTPSKPEMP